MVATVKEIERIVGFMELTVKVGFMQLSVHLKRKNGKKTRRRKDLYYKYRKYIYVIQEHYK
jgi:hypothetical protein